MRISKEKSKFSLMKKLTASIILVFVIFSANGIGLVTNTVIDEIGKAYIAYAASGEKKFFAPITSEDTKFDGGYSTQSDNYHDGYDIYTNGSGKSIYASSDGEVIDICDTDNGGLGKYITIKYSNGVVVKYGHCDTINYQIGKHVYTGDIIATTGTTGGVKNPHVHIMTYSSESNYNKGTYTNPEKYFNMDTSSRYSYMQMQAQILVRDNGANESESATTKTGKLISPIVEEDSKKEVPFSNEKYGYDILTETPKNVYASGNGTVLKVDYTTLGKEITIKYDDPPIIVRYYHCDEINAEKGDTVKAGDKIATSGNTSSNSEIKNTRIGIKVYETEQDYKNDNCIDPEKYFDFDNKLSAEEMKALANGEYEPGDERTRIADKEGNIYDISEIIKNLPEEIREKTRKELEKADTMEDVFTDKEIDALLNCIVRYSDSFAESIKESLNGGIKDITLQEQTEQRNENEKEFLEAEEIPENYTKTSRENLSGEYVEKETNSVYCYEQAVHIPYLELNSGNRFLRYENKIQIGNNSYSIEDIINSRIIIESTFQQTYLYTKPKYYEGEIQCNILDYLARFQTVVTKAEMNQLIWKKEYKVIENGTEVAETDYLTRAQAYDTSRQVEDIALNIDTSKAKVTYDFETNEYYVGPIKANYTFYGILTGGTGAEIFKGIKSAKTTLAGVGEITLTKNHFAYNDGKRSDLGQKFEKYYDYPMPNEEFFLKFSREEAGGNGAKTIENLEFVTEEKIYSATTNLLKGTTEKYLVYSSNNTRTCNSTNCTHITRTNGSTKKCTTQILVNRYIGRLSTGEVKSQTLVTLENVQTPVKNEKETKQGTLNLPLTMNISGMVWLDNDGDNLLNGTPYPESPTVTIIGTMFGHTDTVSDVNYQFDNIPVDKYIIEYTFNGKDYQAVSPLAGGVTSVKSSRATYAPEDLDNFNSNFANIIEKDGKYYIKGLDGTGEWEISQIYGEQGALVPNQADYRPSFHNVYQGAKVDADIIESILGSDAANTIKNATGSTALEGGTQNADGSVGTGSLDVTVQGESSEIVDQPNKQYQSSPSNGSDTTGALEIPAGSVEDGDSEVVDVPGKQYPSTPNDKTNTTATNTLIIPTNTIDDGDKETIDVPGKQYPSTPNDQTNTTVTNTLEVPAGSVEDGDSEIAYDKENQDYLSSPGDTGAEDSKDSVQAEIPDSSENSGIGEHTGILFTQDAEGNMYIIFQLTVSSVFTDVQTYPEPGTMQISLAESKADMPTKKDVPSIFEEGEIAQLGTYEASNEPILNFGVWDKNNPPKPGGGHGGTPGDEDNPGENPGDGDDPVNYPDLELLKDLYEVKLTINGKEKVYKASDLYDEQNKVYNLYITQADYFFRVDNYKANTRNENVNIIKSLLTEDLELKIFVTYKYGYKNNSTNYAATLNALTDWYDEEYEYKEAWYQIGDVKTQMQAEIKPDCKYEGFKELVLQGTSGKVLAPTTTLDVFVTYEVGKETYINGTNQVERSLKIDCDPITKKVAEGQIGKQNIAEIKEYTIYKKETTDADLTTNNKVENVTEKGTNVNGVMVTEATDNKSVISGFNSKTSATSQGIGGMIHDGIDILGNLNDEIRASAKGTVKYVDASRGRVEIDSGNGVEIYYLHMNEIYVKVGDEVNQGDVIGGMGNKMDAYSTTSRVHLHIIMKVNGKIVDPQKYMYNNSSTSTTTTTAKKSVYAGKTDEDSRPGNANPTIPKDKREDDTVEAPRLNILITENERTVNGYVFEDARVNTQEATGQITGNGQYESNTDKLVNGVTVQLVEIITEVNEEGKIVAEHEYVLREMKSGHNAECFYLDLFGNEVDRAGTAMKDSSTKGKYQFSSLHTSNYIIKFIYGDNIEAVLEVTADGRVSKTSYNGLDYKATAYQVGVDNDENDDSYIDNKWDNVTNKGTRKTNGEISDEEYNNILSTFDKDIISDARDDEMRRLELMKLLVNVTNGTASKYDVYTLSAEYIEAIKKGNQEEIRELETEITEFMKATKMFAKTAKMNIEIDSVGLQNVNLGLEERPKTLLQTTTRITKLKLKLQGEDADSELINVIFTYNEAGKISVISGKGLQYIQAAPESETALGFKLVYIEEKLMQGAEISVEVENIVENVSQVDTIGITLYKLMTAEEASDEKTYEQIVIEAIEKACKELSETKLVDKQYGKFLGNTYYTGSYNSDTDTVSETMIKQILNFVPNGLVFDESQNQQENRYWQQITPSELSRNGLIGDNTFARDENGNYIFDEIDGEKVRVILDSNGNSYYTKNRNNLAVNTVGKENREFIKFLKPATAVALLGTNESSKVSMKLNASTVVGQNVDTESLTFNNIFEVVNFISMNGRATKTVIGNINPQEVTAKQSTVLKDGLVGNGITQGIESNHVALGETLTFTPPTGQTEFVLNSNILVTTIVAALIVVSGIIIIKKKILVKK